MCPTAPIRAVWKVHDKMMVGLWGLLAWGLVGLATVAAAWPGVAQAQVGPVVVTDTVVTDCTNDTQLRAAVNVAGPSIVTFDCGAGEHTIPITSAMPVPGTVTVRGAARITLDGRDLNGIFQVFASGNLTLRNLTVANGKFNGIFPLENIGRLTLVNVTVRDNQSTGVGGAIYSIGTLVVRDSRFVDNEGSGVATNTFGAAIYIEGGVATVQNSEFTGNRSMSAIGGGGAIAVADGDMSIESSVFRNNQALDGGALHVSAGTVVTVTNSIFTENKAGYGGAIETRGELQVDYSTFAGNEATGGDGGGIWVLLGGELDMTYSTISGNSANTTGGGISCYDNSISVINSIISGNTAKTFGGGIYSSCDVNLTNSTLSDNTGQGGGGGIYQTNSGAATVAAVTIAANNAPFGAGVYNDGGGGSSLTLQYTMLADNTTGNCDGVITSLGYNLASDNNCSALTQSGDQKNVALPLGPLTGNGGPTLTHFPLRGNPAREAIPAAECGFSADQRGVARPKGTNCEIGSVEVFLSLYMPLALK